MLCISVEGQDEDSTGTDPLPERQCRMLCLNGGQCKIDPVEGAKCICAAGFTGSVCENGRSSCHLRWHFRLLLSVKIMRIFNFKIICGMAH